MLQLKESVQEMKQTLDNVKSEKASLKEMAEAKAAVAIAMYNSVYHTSMLLIAMSVLIFIFLAAVEWFPITHH